MTAHSMPSLPIAPGEALDRLLRPMPVLALALLIVNDHLIKTNHPGWLSGKLSDVAVLALLPFLLLAFADLAALAIPRVPPPGRVALIASVVASVALFTAIELVPVAGDAYRWGLGIAQWPVRAVAALAADAPIPGVLPVRLTFDPSDLFTLPSAAAILLTLPRRSPSPRSSAPR